MYHQPGIRLHNFLDCTIVDETKQLLDWRLKDQVQHETAGHRQYDEAKVKGELQKNQNFFFQAMDGGENCAKLKSNSSV